MRILLIVALLGMTGCGLGGDQIGAMTLSVFPSFNVFDSGTPTPPERVALRCPADTFVECPL